MNLRVGGYKPESDEIDLTINSGTEPQQETHEEEIVVNTEAPVEEPTQTPEPTVETPIENTPQEAVETNTITDELLFGHLSEKLGREVKSLEELIPQQTNPLDEDPYLKQLADWRKQTGRPIEDWIKYQKDYNSMDDGEVVREFLQHKYPTFTKEEIDLKLSDLYPDEDLDDDREIAKKKLQLKELAIDGRSTLNSLKSDLGTPSFNLPPEQKADLELAKKVKEQQVLIDAEQKAYADNIKRVSDTINKFNVQLSDDLAIDYLITDQTRKELPSFLNTMPHWRNQDGSWNHEAVVNDAVKIKHFNDIIKMAYEQGLNSGKEEVIKQSKNSNFQAIDPAASNNQSSSGIVVEGLDELRGGHGLSFKRFNK